MNPVENEAHHDKTHTEAGDFKLIDEDHGDDDEEDHGDDEEEDHGDSWGEP